MKRILFSAILTFVIAPSASAQFGSYSKSTEPSYWIGFGIAALNAQGVNDGASRSTWDFGQRTNWQYLGSLEKTIQNQSSIGIVVTFAHLPFTYRNTSVNFPDSCPACTSTVSQGASCGGQCAAHLDMMSLAAQFHAGGGTGFHQVLDAALGATEYRNLKRDSDGALLAPAKGNVDWSFDIGYGFGYGLSNSTEITLTQDYGLVLHESTGLPSGTSNTNTLRLTRLGIRFGFGSQAPSGRRR
jgi:hypothetical protein